MSRTIASPLAGKPVLKMRENYRERFQRAVAAAEALTPKQRERLVEKLRKESAANGHARIVEDVRQAREEIKRGEGSLWHGRRNHQSATAMNKLVLSPAFQRRLKRFIRKHPQAAPKIAATIKQLENDHTHPSLRTHMLGGDLDGTWSCTAGYDVRILFDLDQVPNSKQIRVTLVSIGTHDEVY